MNKSAKTGIILGDNITGVNQILPHKHKWAWEMYIKGRGNNWMPNEVPMQDDISQWNSTTKLSDDERLVIKRQLGFFCGSESLVSNNLMGVISKWVTDPECRQYLLQQQAEEGIHNHTMVYVCDSLSLDPMELYEAHRNIPSIKAKDDFLMEITANISRPDFNTSTIEGKREFLRNLITYYIICEGIFFFSGFALLLSFGRQNKLPGISKQIEYTLRDETMHIQFGVELIRIIKEQNPGIWTKEFEQDTLAHINRAMELEIAYAKDVLPNGILGVNSGMFVDYMKFIANRRIAQLGIDHSLGDAKNPFPWLGETIEMAKNTNFFEAKVVNYQTGQVVDDF